MKSFLKNTVLMLVSLLVTILVLEGAVRWVVPQDVGLQRITLHESHYEPDDELVYVPKKNLQEKGNFGSTFTTNSQGFRDKEHPLEKPPGVTRVVAIGDSFTWGRGVNDGQVFTDLLEEKLNNVEVINLGVSGYALRQETGYLRRKGLPYKPDIVVVGFCLNDIYVDRRTKVQHATGPVVERTQWQQFQKDGLFLYTKRVLGTYSHLYGLIQSRVNTNPFLVNLLVDWGIKDELTGFRGISHSLKPALKVYPASLQSAMASTKAELLELKSLTDRHGIKLLVAIIPYKQSVMQEDFLRSVNYTKYSPDDFDLDKPYRILMEFAKARGIDMIAPAQEFRDAQEKQGELYLRADIHFNTKGHDVFANAIARHKFFAGAQK